MSSNNLVSNNFDNIDTKKIFIKYIFDPLSTIIKLSILSNKPLNSKISIKNNIISIQECGIFQGLVRYYWLNNKEDLHYLAIPIFLACEKYLNKKYIDEIPEIKILFITAQNGLLKLMETYTNYPLIVHCLQYYHTIINTYLGNEENNNLFNNFKKINNIDNNIEINENTKINENTQIQNDKQIENDKQKDKKDLNKIQSNKDNINKDNTNKESIKNDINKKDNKKNANKTEIIIGGLKETNKKNIKQNINISHNKILMEFYTTEILTNFYNIWNESKINIVIDMTKYLLGEKQAADYARSIEIFMIPVDNLVYSYVENFV